MSDILANKEDLLIDSHTMATQTKEILMGKWKGEDSINKTLP